MSKQKRDQKFFEHNIAVALTPPPPTLELWLLVDNHPEGDIVEERLTIVAVQARSMNKYSAFKRHPNDYSVPNPLDHRDNDEWSLWHSELAYSCVYLDEEFGLISTDDGNVDAVNVRFVVVDAAKPEQAARLKVEAVESLKNRRSKKAG